MKDLRTATPNAAEAHAAAEAHFPSRLERAQSRGFEHDEPDLGAPPEMVGEWNHAALDAAIRRVDAVQAKDRAWKAGRR